MKKTHFFSSTKLSIVAIKVFLPNKVLPNSSTVALKHFTLQEQQKNKEHYLEVFRLVHFPNNR